MAEASSDGGNGGCCRFLVVEVLVRFENISRIDSDSRDGGGTSLTGHYRCWKRTVRLGHSDRSKEIRSHENADPD